MNKYSDEWWNFQDNGKAAYRLYMFKYACMIKLCDRVFSPAKRGVLCYLQASIWNTGLGQSLSVFPRWQCSLGSLGYDSTYTDAWGAWPRNGLPCHCCSQTSSAFIFVTFTACKTMQNALEVENSFIVHCEVSTNVKQTKTAWFACSRLARNWKQQRLGCKTR